MIIMRCSTAKHLKRIFILAILLMLLGGCATLHQRGDLPVEDVETEAIIKLIKENFMKLRFLSSIKIFLFYLIIVQK